MDEDLRQLLRDGLQFADQARLASVPGRLEAMRVQRPELPDLCCTLLCRPDPPCEPEVRVAAGTVLKQLLLGCGGGSPTVRAALLASALSSEEPVMRIARMCVATAVRAAGGPKGWPEAVPQLCAALAGPAEAAKGALALLEAVTEDHPDAFSEVADGRCLMAGVLPAVLPLLSSPDPEAALLAVGIAAELMTPSVETVGPSHALQEEHAAAYIAGLVALSARMPPGSDPAAVRLLCRALGDSCHLWHRVDAPVRAAVLSWACSHLEAGGSAAAAGFWADAAGCEPAAGPLRQLLPRVVPALMAGVRLTPAELSEMSNEEDAHIPDTDRTLAPRYRRRLGRGAMAGAHDVDSDGEEEGGGEDDVVANVSVRTESLHSLSVLADSFEKQSVRALVPALMPALTGADPLGVEAALQVVGVTAEACASEVAPQLPELLRVAVQVLAGAAPVVREAALHAITEIGCAVLTAAGADSDDDEEEEVSVAGSEFIGHIVSLLVQRARDGNKRCQATALRGVAQMCSHGCGAAFVPPAVCGLAAALPTLQLAGRREAAFAIGAVFSRRPSAAASSAPEAVAGLVALLSKPGSAGDIGPAFAACGEVVAAAGSLPALVDLVPAACVCVQRTVAAAAAKAPTDLEAAIHALDVVSAAADGSGSDFGRLVGGNCALIESAFQLYEMASFDDGARMGGVHPATLSSLLWSVSVVCGDFAKNAYGLIAATPGCSAAITGFLVHHLVRSSARVEGCVPILSNLLWSLSEVVKSVEADVVAPHAAVVAALCADVTVSSDGDDIEEARNAAHCLARLCRLSPAAVAAVPQSSGWAQRVASLMGGIEGEEVEDVAVHLLPHSCQQSLPLVASHAVSRWRGQLPQRVRAALGPAVAAATPGPVDDPVLLVFEQGDADGDGRWGYTDANGVAGGTLGVAHWNELCAHFGETPSRGCGLDVVRSLYGQGIRSVEADYAAACERMVAAARQRLSS
eukprot:TRINITY_DN1619_c2_g1_i1.p1 TRINITY_DN1619_c2_g1~~TRINITY_DN1619_c2_g1_i1.p1  ORF type:complete len:1017 (+),score=354.08 TRINITY_DN1619_c2_g1_i1:130-3051(+)